MYQIDIPPPTISGDLHMGHLFSYTHMDIIARYQSMRGNMPLYPFCYDNNGLPTEKLAQKQGIRDQADIITFSNTKSADYYNTFSSMGMGFSPHHYSTFSPMAQVIAKLSFEDLLAKDLIYKGESDYFFCPLTGVSVSQAELTEDMRYERSGAKVEIKRGEGYFIRMVDHLDEFRDAVNQIEWHPEFFKERLLNWIDGINLDWSIGRERNYGIPIPGEPGMVFDTWFTSSLSPQMVWSSLTGQPSLKVPIFDVRFQAHDIIRTWALFTIVKSLYHNQQIPWRQIVISGHTLDAQGKKLSKSSANYKPTDYYLKNFGAEGIRYWAARGPIGTDTKINEPQMLQGKKLINKIRNARRFIALQDNRGTNADWLKEWIDVKDKIDAAFDGFQIHAAMELLYNFFWGRFCDVFIEESKTTPSNFTLQEIEAEMMLYWSLFFPQVDMQTRPIS